MFLGFIYFTENFFLYESFGFMENVFPEFLQGLPLYNFLPQMNIEIYLQFCFCDVYLPYQSQCL